MSSNLLTASPRCDLVRLERTNMVTKMEDRVKVDLVSMSKLILEHLQLCDPGSLPHSPEMINRLAVQFNQGALLQYQYGEVEKAETLCHGQIQLFARLSLESSSRATCLANMVAPYINLARIHGQKGNVKESLDIFEAVYRFGLQQHDLAIFGNHISVSDAPAMAAVAPGQPKVMLSCRVVEAARVLLTVEDYPALLALADVNQNLPEYQEPFFKQYLLEIESRALLALGRYDLAMATLNDCCNQMATNSVDRIVVHALLSQIYREWGRCDSATDTLNKLEELLAAVEPFGKRLPALRHIAYRLAVERYAMGDHARAMAPAEKAFKWCREWNDQPGSIKSAILLLRLHSDPALNDYSAENQKHWYNQLQQLAATTFFRLERACAYWELGLSSDSLSSEDGNVQESACELLQKSYNLYRSIPFVESRQSCEALQRCLEENWKGGSAGMLRNEMMMGNSPSIDSVYDALMEYVPKSL